MGPGLSLRHTGLQVVDARIKLVAPGLVGLDGVIVGQITIDAEDDFTEVYEPLGDPPVLDADQFYDWMVECRTEAGDPVDPAEIFDWLRAEYATDRMLQHAAREGLTVAQGMVPHGDAYLPGPAFLVLSFETRDQIKERAERCGCPDGTWWRIFNGTSWDELSPAGDMS